MNLFPYFAIAIALGFFLKKRRKKTKKVEHNWSDFADALFEKHGKQNASETKLREILTLGSQKLNLRYGLVCAQSESGVKILAHSTSGYWPFQFKTGDSLSSEAFFCGRLNSARETIMIDFASLTDWRKHPAYHQLGIETYMGAYLPEAGTGISISFFDTTPRDHLFGRTDKEFLRQLGTWVSSHLRGREMLELANARIENGALADANIPNA